MIDFSLYKIVQILLPQRKRRTRFVAWLTLSVSYLDYIQQQLYQLWSRSLELSHMSPQIIAIEGFLHRMYGRQDIQIVDGYELGPWEWPQVNPDESFYDQEDSFEYSDSDTTTLSFVVNLPTALSQEAPVVAAWVSKYKLPGMSFIIQIK